MKRKLVIAGVVTIVVIAATGTWTVMGAGAPQLDRAFYDDSPRPFSYAPYARVLKRFVDGKGMVDYAGLKADRGDLDLFVRMVGRLDPKVYDAWPTPAKLAFWTNAYNALTLKLIVDYYPIKPRPFGKVLGPANSIKQIPKRWKSRFFLAMGKAMSLDQIEHEMLRQKGVEADKRIFEEPRIHVALVCAAASCPPLRNEPFDATRLQAQFADQARKFLADPKRFRIDTEADAVYLSSIFKWFGGDFVAKYLPADGFGSSDDSVRATLNYVAGSVKGEQAEYLRRGEYKVKYLTYDWSLNLRTTPVPTTQPVEDGDDR